MDSGQGACVSTVDLPDHRQLGSRVAGSTELLDIRLFASECNLYEFPPEGETLRTVVTVTPTVQTDETRTFVANLTFSIEVKTNTELSDQVMEVAAFKCSYGALYATEGEGEFEHDELEAFTASVGALAMYPYARQFVHAQSTAMGLAPLVMPIHRLSTPWQTHRAD